MSRLNMTNEQFWKSTIQEIWAAMDAWEMRREYESDFERAMVYAGETLRRAKRLPSMNAWLNHGKRRNNTEQEIIKGRNDHASILRKLPPKLQARIKGGVLHGG